MGGMHTTSYTVYGAAGSGSVPVEAALELIGAPYTVVQAATWEGDAERDKVAGVNPMRQVPALVMPTGEVLTESGAILLWLADAHPEANLAPPIGDPRRAQYLRWMVFIPASIYSMYWVRDVPSRLAEGEAAETVIRQRTAERIAACWHTMDQQLQPAGPYLLGDTLTVLDLYVTGLSRWTPGRERFVRDAPALAAVVQRVEAEPRLAGFWARRNPAAG
jgi:GST-like protein